MKSRAVCAAWVIVLAACRAPERAPSERLDQLLRHGEEAESRGDGQAAGVTYEQAVRDFGNHSSSWSHLGEHRRFWQRDPGGASEAFRKAIQAPVADPKAVAFAWRGLGEVARSAGRVDEAVENFQKSISISPTTEAYRSLSALYATEKRDFERARHYAVQALKQDTDDPIALMQFAVQMVRFKDLHEAEKAFAMAIRFVGCDERGRSNDHVHCCVLYNGACYHAVRGDKAGALAMLKEFFITPNHRHITKEEILRDPDFESLIKDPDFQAMLEYRLPIE